jgi:ATP-dependent Clp endopeptidase proteolytic subunit ClpP
MSEKLRDKAERQKFEAEKRLLDLRCQKEEIDLRYSRAKEDDWRAGAYQNRIYNFFGPVDRKSAADCMETMSYWYRRDPQCDITIVFNSPGGSVIDGLALYDELLVMREDGHFITTVARGMAASMGAVLLQAGDQRIIGKNASMLIHEISTGVAGSFGELMDEVEFTKQLQDKLLDILAERSTLSKRKIKSRWERRDWWLGADEVLANGFADRIG